MSAIRQTSSLPVGSVVDFAGSVEPSGWLFCFGQSLLRAGTYAPLFAAIGTQYGAVDGTHFSVPDCRGRTSAGKDNMGGTAVDRMTTTYFGADAKVLGAIGGTESYQLNLNHVAGHAHYMNNMVVYTAGSGIASGTGYGYTNSLSQAQGGDFPHPNCQPTIIFNKIIRY